MSLINQWRKCFDTIYRKSIGYVPYYNRDTDINPQEPEIYNKNGERMRVFFISDRSSSHDPYFIAYSEANYILWDRYNFGLKTHFYESDLLFRPVGKPDRRYAVQFEPRSIQPRVYDRILREKSYIENELDALFTHSEELLNAISNAKFYPACSSCWYGRIDKSVKVSPDACKYKDRGISILASKKSSCKMHVIRQETARRCLRNNWADAFGTFRGGGSGFVNPEVTLQHYMYSIVIENDITPYFFTEKLTNCFASQTIPIYLGATQISKFFNPDGIITISLEDLDRLDEVLKQCTPEEYQRRLPAILDNFERVKEYSSSLDWLYLHYFK